MYRYITGKHIRHNKTSDTDSTGFVDDVSHAISNKNFNELEIKTGDAQNLITKLYGENL